MLALPVAQVSATPRLTVGFFDDPSFRWAAAPDVNFELAQKANASVVHVLADWSQIAEAKPASPLDGDDPAYALSDLDALVRTAPLYNLQVMITISGTPKWANGGKAPNHAADEREHAHARSRRCSRRATTASTPGSAPCRAGRSGTSPTSSSS